MNADTHPSTEFPILYGASYSVYVRIARMTLHEKGVAYRHQSVDIFKPDTVPAAYARLHPFGRIPALTHGDVSLYETQAITRYVDEAFPGPLLQPGNPIERARMNQAMGIVDSYAYRALVWDLYVESVSKPARGERADEVRIQRALPHARTSLQALSALLGEKEFLAARTLTLADLHLAPVFGYFTQTKESEGLLATCANLRAWWTAMKQRPGWQAACT